MHGTRRKIHFWSCRSYAQTLRTSSSKHRGNENIKPELTELNYNLASEDQPMPQATFVTQRLKGVRVQKRADVNVLCDWVITQPQELPADKG